MAETTADSVETVSQTWNEAKYEEALKHLDQLQAQLDIVRSVIPSLVSPCTKPHPTPEQFYQNFRTAALEAIKEIKGLKESWETEKTRIFLERVSHIPIEEPEKP